jgi:SAM-dependent methyltransferase
MHNAAMEYIFSSFHNWKDDRTNLKVLEIGSLDINGSVRPMFKPFASKYVGLDTQAGPGVDIVYDAAKFTKPNAFDVVVCAEVFEHTPEWQTIIKKSYKNLVNGGLFIATMAGEGRRPHSAIDAGEIREWEHYANIGEWQLKQTLTKIGFKDIIVNVNGTDTRCSAVK